ncbi:dTDP-4-dehydrorhamnose reductase [Mastigocoleus testarum]|uniref:dTDP-4-dehydrorhamnose reductase n=1 Tax=Mastigocoleus testarum BC008 TaxID=371196 RepID=A0A0V7ZSK4_9CYAN|nr:dTDP-4-dehydrorhamnose reductase [Mastigocoleus testarum]KST67362.1 dTDP-4-dehydrorhamnose reductase [Mastigocoleus testarum BC008]
MKILLTGVTGQVGWELQRTLITLGEVITSGRDTKGASLQMDLTQPDSIRYLIREVKPDLIVNPAAYTAVDKAESEPELAMMVNGTAPGVIAEEAKQIGAAVVHYSTDYVFDGESQKPYTELDTTNPQNIYGKTKLAGEQAIQAVEVPHLILRTSWVYSLRGKNFLLTMLRLGRERKELRVVDDQIGAPTWSGAIAKATTEILAGANENVSDYLTHKAGIYHLSASGKTSWYGFAKAIFENDINEQKLESLVPISSEEYPTPAKRPAYSLLDCGKLSNSFGVVLSDWEESLKVAIAPNNKIQI